MGDSEMAVESMKTCIWIFVDIWDLQFFYILLVVQESSFRLLFANLKLHITRYQQFPSNFRIHVYVCGGPSLTTVHTFRTLCANFLSTHCNSRLLAKLQLAFVLERDLLYLRSLTSCIITICCPRLVSDRRSVNSQDEKHVAMVHLYAHTIC